MATPRDSAKQIRRVLIAGGGTAGWMCAAALSRFLPKSVSITLVESDAIGTIGVGEATIPTLADFNRMLGIDEDEFLRETSGTFKLGIEFVGWGKEDDRYFHPFGQFGLDQDGVAFHQMWSRCRLAGETRPLDAWSINTQAARANTFLRPNTQDPRSPLSQLRHAYHVDATAYAAYLRRFAERLGVKRVEGRIESVQQDPESGHIDAVTLDGQQRHEADLFIDCTGFRALLIGETLGTEFEDWSHWLPCDRAVAVTSEHPAGEPLAPYTRATARAAGWQWRIPLQHRVGNGHVFCSAAMSEEEATEQLMDSLPGPALREPRLLKFQTGRRQAFWKANCVALGLSSGFLEPLESTSIHFIQTGISRLLGLFPDRDFVPDERDEYNRQMASAFEHVRDFIILHYHLNQRTDSAFWQQLRDMPVPGSVTAHMAQFERNGRHFAHPESLFTAHNWVAVMAGQNLSPRATDPLAEVTPLETSQAMLGDLLHTYQEAASRMPPHQAFIERFCARAQTNPQEALMS